MTNHIAVVPTKGLHESKTRLSSVLSREFRTALVIALLQDVTNSLYETKVFDNILVISPDRLVEETLKLRYVNFLKQNGIGLNAAIRQAANDALKMDAGSMTVVLGDIPLATSADFLEVFRLGGDKSKVVLSPSLKAGTNTMTLSPPNSIPPSYGRWSYSRHLRLAQKRWLSVYSISNPRLSFDIDTPNDLEELVRLDPEAKTNAGRLAQSIFNIATPKVKKPR